MKIAGVEVRSSSRTSTSTRNPRPTPGHPHSTRKSRFSRASEIEELRAENLRLRQQVATLEARLRAAYADAGVTALAGSSPTPEVAVSTAPSSAAAVPSPATASDLDLSPVELQMIAERKLVNAVKSYRDRTGVDLKTAKAAIDAAR